MLVFLSVCLSVSLACWYPVHMWVVNSCLFCIDHIVILRVFFLSPFSSGVCFCILFLFYAYVSNEIYDVSEESELQCVPGRFECVEEYVRVFEPLLFEECRAQLYSTWEELTETGSRDTHVMVRIRNIERRERGTCFSKYILFCYFHNYIGSEISN